MLSHCSPISFLIILFLFNLFPERNKVFGGGLNSWKASSSRHRNKKQSHTTHDFYSPPLDNNQSIPFNFSDESISSYGLGGFDFSSSNYSLPLPPLEDECFNFYYAFSSEDSKNNNSKNYFKILQCILRELVDLKKEQQREKEVRSSSSQSDFLPNDYDKLEVPVIVQPMHIEFFLNVGEVTEFGEKEDYIGFDMEVISGWTDDFIRDYSEQLELEGKPVIENDLYFSGEFLDKLWSPDFFFQEIATVNNPKMQLEPRTVVVNPKTGYVKFKQRLILMLYCDFDFYYYPADTQQCSFNIRSYTYATNLVNLSWYDSGIYMHRAFDYNFEYQVVSATQSERVVPMGPLTYPDEKYATLEFVFKSRRKLSYHMVQTYVPSVLLEVVTWICFLISREQSELRVGISMTTLLTMTSMFNSVRASTPVVSYMKAIDVWMLGCIVFLFLKLAGFITIAWMKTKKEKAAAGGDEITTYQKDENSPKKIEMDEKLDRILVLAMPSTFTICVIIYWTWLLLASKYYSWTLHPLYNNLKPIPGRIQF